MFPINEPEKIYINQPVPCCLTNSELDGRRYCQYKETILAYEWALRLRNTGKCNLHYSQHSHKGEFRRECEWKRYIKVKMRTNLGFKSHSETRTKSQHQIQAEHWNIARCTLNIARWNTGYIRLKDYNFFPGHNSRVFLS